MTVPAALELDGITKRFGDVRALDGASIAVRRGTVHALLGENGAGKTTLMHVAFGLIRPEGGVLRVEGRPVRFASPADAIAAGVGMVHQHFTLVPAMTVAENVALGARGRYRVEETRDRVRAIGRETGLALDPDATVASLAVSAQQRLEIVKALARGARILILDEPTAVLAPAEVGELLAALRRFVEAGGTVILITHKLREALSTADDVTVLRRGRTVATLRASAATQRTLARAMLGEETAGADPIADVVDGFDQAEPPRHAEAPADYGSASTAGVVIAARELDVRDERGVLRVRRATFEVRAGVIVGVAGIEGAGQRELLRAIAGRLEPSGGTLSAPRPVAFIPEDRHRDALVLDFALHENVALKGAGRARGRIAWPVILGRTAELLHRFDVRASGPRAVTRTLSGGNQQKLVLARELEREPAVVVAENPTRGLDVAATAAVRERLRAARDAGAAVLIYSSDLDEVLALADQVLVLFDGTLRTDVPRDREAVGRAMLGIG